MLVEPPNAYRVSGALMIASGLINASVAAVWVLSLFVVCVGLLWIVPMAIGLGEAVVGLLLVLGVPIRFGRAAALIGLVNGALLLSPPSVALEVLAFVFLQQDGSQRYVALPSPTDPARSPRPDGEETG